MGSSRVMMWASRVRLMRSMMQAWVVDLPLPAGAGDQHHAVAHRSQIHHRLGDGQGAVVGNSKATTRTTAAREPRCR